MKANIVIGKADAPLIIALHGYGQSIAKKPWWRISDFWFFGSSGIVETCDTHDWSCWMPQAPRRNWNRFTAFDGPLLIDAARSATQSKGPVFIAGFSQGGELVNKFMQSDWASGYVSYSGMDIDIVPRGPALLLRNTGELERIRRETDLFAARFDVAPQIIEIESTRHAWERWANGRIFGWIKHVASNLGTRA